MVILTSRISCWKILKSQLDTACIISINCNTLQHTATHCNTLQHTATHCNTLQHTATPCNTLQNPATPCKPCNTLQHPAAPTTSTSHVTQQYVTSHKNASCPASFTGGVLRGKLHLVAGREFAPSRLQSLLDHEIGFFFFVFAGCMCTSYLTNICRQRSIMLDDRWNVYMIGGMYT